MTVASGKFWSNGLDVDWIAAHPADLATYLDGVHGLLARMLAFPAPTAAAVQGHAFGAGAMLALTHDWQFMRSDRGYLCLPEVDLGVAFSDGMLALLQAKLTPAQSTEMLLTSRRFGGQEARAVGLVTDAVEQDQLRELACTHIEARSGKPGATLGQIKRDLYADVLKRLQTSAAETRAA